MGSSTQSPWTLLALKFQGVLTLRPLSSHHRGLVLANPSPSEFFVIGLKIPLVR